jgi:type IV pilus assembly protein PilY1
MRFGGTPVEAGDIYSGDTRVFKSAYFILDITNPEAPPTLLGETTTTTDGGEISLAYTLAIPTMVPMKDGTTTEWNLILGSGPTDINGTSDQNARLAVIPLHDRMNPGSLKSLRIPAAPPSNSGLNEDMGTILIPDANSFISDLITVDLETRPDYKADVVYFGTVNGGWTESPSAPPDGWGGKLYRMVTRSPGIIASGTSQVISRPNEWPGLLSSYTSLTNPNVLYNPGQPIISAPTVGTDGRDFWVYFGTGRFFDVLDKTDVGSNDIQTYYGIREPIECGGTIYGGPNWKTVTNSKPTGPPASSALRGDIGLLSVDDIAIRQMLYAEEKTSGAVGCYDNGAFVAVNNQCIPGIEGSGDPLETNGSFEDLTQYIAGSDVFCKPGTSPGFDGWSRDLPYTRERNLGQATLLGELISFTTYIPNANLCNPEGAGYLYGIYYKTGTPWYKDVFGRSPIMYGEPIGESVFLGAGLTTTPNIHVGEQEGGKAFIQTSVGQIIEIPQPNLPSKDIKTGRIKWRDIEQ